MKFTQLMSEVIGAETLYEIDLRESSRKMSVFYIEWTKNLLSGKNANANEKLLELEFSLHRQICEKLMEKTSELVRDLDKFIFIDTSSINVVLEKTRQQLAKAENNSRNNNSLGDCIQLLKDSENSLFDKYSEWKAKKSNLERNAIIKWLSALGGGYGAFMLIYLGILSYMKVESNFIFGIAIPVIVGFCSLLAMFLIISRDGD